ncbi:hypothetical protein E4T44_05855, partial [Aureobasidium sp. EXF-8845]
LVDIGTDSDSKLKTLEDKLQETLAENAALSKQSQLLRPTTPLNKTISYSRSASVGSLSQRSIGEDYFGRSESDLSDMGRVISANEPLFIQKIKDHVDNLEQARDRVNDVYKQKYDDMVDDTARREEQLESQHTTELEAARKRLRATYSQPSDAEIKTSVSAPFDSDDLQTKDNRLVLEHAERLANRKSQVQHHFQVQFLSLSEEYDKKIAEMLGEKDMLDSDLSIGPERFEEMSEQVDRFYSATTSPASVRHRPLRSQTSIDHLVQSSGSQRLYRNIERSRPSTRAESPGGTFSRPQSSASAHGSLRRKTSHGRLSSFIGRMSSPFSSSRSSRSSASGTVGPRPHTTGHGHSHGTRVVSTPPPSSRPDYFTHSISEGSSTLGRHSVRPMTAEAREHAEMDFSIAPERFEALQKGKREEEGRRGSAVAGAEQQSTKSPRILRHISGSIRKKMAS